MEEEEDEVVVVVVVNVAAFVVVAAVFFEVAGDAEAEDETEVDFVVSLIVLLRTWQVVLDELDELLCAVKLLPGGRERVLLLSSVSARRQQRIS